MLSIIFLLYSFGITTSLLRHTHGGIQGPFFLYMAEQNLSQRKKTLHTILLTKNLLSHR